jgi:hypothetical protein
MRRFDDPEGWTIPELHGESVPRPLSWWLFRAGRVVLLSVLVSVPLIPALFFLMPMPRGADGITLCFPVLGPLQQYSSDLDPGLEEIVHLHERVHADQCRRLGAWDYARTYLRDEGMLDLEAEAFCAEAHMLASRGLDTDPWVRRVVETLYVDYPHGPDVTYADVDRIVSNWCPASVSPTPRTSHP